MSATKPRVLVVEDDPASADAMRLLLRHYGYEVSHAGTVASAKQQLASDLAYVFLDLMLPDGDGAAVLEELRRVGLSSKVAVITGTTDADQLRRIKSLAPDLMFKKPLDFFQLLEKIKSTQ
jgi:DNA-binding response OmpR family regulator